MMAVSSAPAATACWQSSVPAGFGVQLYLYGPLHAALLQDTRYKGLCQMKEFLWCQFQIFHALLHIPVALPLWREILDAGNDTSEVRL